MLRATNSRHVADGKVVPLTRGKLSIQWEGAEAFFRNIVIRKLDKEAASTLPAGKVKQIWYKFSVPEARFPGMAEVRIFTTVSHGRACVVPLYLGTFVQITIVEV